MKTDGIIFDIDGTIWDSTGLVAGAWNEAAKETGFGSRYISADDLKSLFGRKMDDIVLALFPEESEEDRAVILKACVQKEQDYLHNDSCQNLEYEGIREVIRQLSRKYPLFIVSNCQSGYIELVCDKLSLQEYIKDSECYGDTLKGKAENLKLLIERNALKAPVYVGDTDGDRSSCEEAGVPFVFAAYGFGQVESYAARVEKPEDLLKLF